MQPADFTRNSWARAVRAPTGYWASVPRPLPPTLRLDWSLASALASANHALGQLAGAAGNLPNPNLLIRPFVRREAVLSSRIEGTLTSLSDLFFFEAAPDSPPPDRPPPADVREVANYVEALGYGLKRLGALPLSLRFLRELHQHLMKGVRGEHLTPGEFRRSQNWIGPPGCSLDQAAFVPPPVPEMHQALAALERFLHEPGDLPPLVRLAMVHYQLEAIHPFLDGNGRVGRLLISVLLVHEGLLPYPLLYLSAFFEARRQDYYQALLDVSVAGRWPEWVGFFLEGVEQQARDALWRIGRLLALRERYHDRVATARSSALLHRVVDGLFENPALTIADAARRLRVTRRSAALNVEKLVRLGVLKEVTGRERYRIYFANGVLDALEVGRQT